MGRANAEQAPASDQQKFLDAKNEVVADLTAAAEGPKRTLRNPDPRYLPTHFILTRLQQTQNEKGAFPRVRLMVAAQSVEFRLGHISFWRRRPGASFHATSSLFGYCAPYKGFPYVSRVCNT